MKPNSIPIHSLNPLPYGEDEAAQPPERKRAERNDAYRVYEEIIKDNIAYDILLQDRSLDRDRLNEIVDLMLETVCTATSTCTNIKTIFDSIKAILL